MDYLLHPDIINSRGMRFNTKIRGAVNQILREIKKLPVGDILKAKEQNESLLNGVINVYCVKLPSDLRLVIFRYCFPIWSFE